MSSEIEDLKSRVRELENQQNLDRYTVRRCHSYEEWESGYTDVGWGEHGESHSGYGRTRYHFETLGTGLTWAQACDLRDHSDGDIHIDRE